MTAPDNALIVPVPLKPRGEEETAVYPLPPEMVRHAVHRLGWLGLVFAVSFPAWRVLNWQAQRSWITSGAEFSFGVTILGMVIGAGVCLAAWSGKPSAQVMLSVGLWFEVAGGLLISLAENSVPLSPGSPVRSPSVVAVWVAAAGLLIPAPLEKATLAAIATALSAPVGLVLMHLVNRSPWPTTGQWVILFFPVFLMAIWAVTLSRLIYRLGIQAGKARAMGSYHLIELIGKGGMGEVWRARHLLLAREAAVKLISPDALSSTTEDRQTVVRRFQQEAQVTATLHSPHTVALYDYGLSEDGSLYYVMELLDGIDLKELVRRYGPLPARRAVYIIEQVCDSIGEAHSKGLVHRDVKPANILVCRLGEESDFVKVLDFGLAKPIVSSTDPGLSAAGLVVGTPAYMAPEIALGSRVADHRSDIYSLGCVGYWLLTGSHVFSAGSALAMAMAHVGEIPTPPSQRAEQEIEPALDRVILSCLEKDPGDRPQTARALKALLSSRDIGVRWTREDADRWWQVHLPTA